MTTTKEPAMSLDTLTIPLEHLPAIYAALEITMNSQRSAGMPLERMVPFRAAKTNLLQLEEDQRECILRGDCPACGAVVA